MNYFYRFVFIAPYIYNWLVIAFVLFYLYLLIIYIFNSEIVKLVFYKIRRGLANDIMRVEH